MGKIHIIKSHDQELDKARDYANDTAESLAQKFGAKYHWDGDQVLFKGAGVKGYLQIASDSIEVKMELSFMLMAFKSRIEQEINSRLDTFCSS